MLFEKYANPFLLLDEMISSCRFLEFVSEFMRIHNEKIENETLWEYYLHKVFDKTYVEYRNECKPIENQETQQEDIPDFEATVKSSMNILQDFT